MLAKEAVDIVKQCDGHHHQEHCTASALQAFHPGIGYGFARHGLPKIIQQVSAIEDWHRQEVQDTETNANQRQKYQVLGKEN